MASRQRFPYKIVEKLPVTWCKPVYCSTVNNRSYRLCRSLRSASLKFLLTQGSSYPIVL